MQPARSTCCFRSFGALSHDVFTRPRGTWAAAPFLLAITPFLTGVIGIFFARALPYGYLSVLLTVGGAVALIFLLKSPIAPAISAGLLPLVLGVKSWWYLLGVLLGTVLLAALSLLWKRLSLAQNWLEPLIPAEVVDEAIEQAPAGSYWLIALMLFVAAAVFFVKLTGLRFVLFPPLVVIGFEMFGHTATCPWARRPMFLPAACFLTALGGLLFWNLLGAGPAAAACSMACGIVVLRLFDLHGRRSRRASSARDELADNRLSVVGRHRDTPHNAMVSFVPVSGGTTLSLGLIAALTASASTLQPRGDVPVSVGLR